MIITCRRLERVNGTMATFTSFLDTRLLRDISKYAAVEFWTEDVKKESI